jgi:hypothetical protein
MTCIGLARLVEDDVMCQLAPVVTTLRRDLSLSDVLLTTVAT